VRSDPRPPGSLDHQRSRDDRREHSYLPTECCRHGERDDEERAHPADKEKPAAKMIGGDRVRQPGVAVIHPPDHREHENDLGNRHGISARD